MDVSGYEAGSRVMVHIRRDPIPFMTDKGPKAIPTGTVQGYVVASTPDHITLRVIDGEAGPLVTAGVFRISGDDVWAIGEPSELATGKPPVKIITT